MDNSVISSIVQDDPFNYMIIHSFWVIRNFRLLFLTLEIPNEILKTIQRCLLSILVNPYNMLYIFFPTDNIEVAFLQDCLCKYECDSHLTKNTQYKTVVFAHEILRKGKLYCQKHSTNLMKNFLNIENINEAKRNAEVWCKIIGEEDLYQDQNARICNIDSHSSHDRWFLIKPNEKPNICKVCQRLFCDRCMVLFQCTLHGDSSTEEMITDLCVNCVYHTECGYVLEDDSSIENSNEDAIVIEL
jgi:hypothetical protein